MVYKYLFESLLLFLLGIYSKVEWLDLRVILFFILKELPYFFPCQLHHCTVPPAVYKGSNFSTSSPILVILWLFIYFLIKAILLAVKWLSHLVLIYIFLTISNVEHLFICSLAICITSLENCLFKFFTCFWIRLFGFCCWVLGVLYIFYILIPYPIGNVQTRLSFENENSPLKVKKDSGYSVCW